jgi:hypothetical protein
MGVSVSLLPFRNVRQQLSFTSRFSLAPSLNLRNSPSPSPHPSSQPSFINHLLCSPHPPQPNRRPNFSISFVPDSDYESQPRDGGSVPVGSNPPAGVASGPGDVVDAPAKVKDIDYIELPYDATLDDYLEAMQLLCVDELAGKGCRELFHRNLARIYARSL